MIALRSSVHGLRVLPLLGMPEVRPGDHLADLVTSAAAAAGIALDPWDVVVVTHKVVSKAEGALVSLAAVTVSAEAEGLAATTGKDARLVEVILSQTRRVIRARTGLLICETVHGLVCANAGVDRSNVGGGEMVSLLPVDPDASARRLRDSWLAEGPLGVVIADTFGRPFREGLVNVAVGVAGMPALSDHRSGVDSHGRALEASLLATADEIAGAAELVMGKADGVPVVVVRGLRWDGPESSATELQREPRSDVFRLPG